MGLHATRSFAQVPSADDLDWIKRYPLSYLTRELTVIVEPVREDLQRQGITNDWLKASTELRLRRSGFTVQDFAGWLRNPSRHKGHITVLVNGGAISATTYIAYVGLSVHQDAFLHGAARPFSVQTWNVGSVEVGLQIQEVVRSSLEDKLDRFINDFAAAHEPGFLARQPGVP